MSGGRRQRIPKHIVDRVCELLREGRQQKEAADLTGVSTTQVARIRRQYNIPSPRPLRTASDEAGLRRALGEWMLGRADGLDLRIAQCLIDGLSNAATGSALGVSDTSVGWRVRDWMMRFDAEGSTPTPHVSIGPASAIDPDALAGRLMHAIDDLGAVQLICYRGTLAAAVPGSRMSRLAERSRPCALVGTYTAGADPQRIADDIREAMR